MASFLNPHPTMSSRVQCEQEWAEVGEAELGESVRFPFWGSELLFVHVWRLRSPSRKCDARRGGGVRRAVKRDVSPCFLIACV